MRVLAAIALSVVVMGGAWFAIGPGAGPPVGGCAPATQASADRFVPDGADSGDVTWDRDWRIGGGSDFAEEIVLDVAAFNDGFVAAGRRSVGGRTNAFLLRSGDGVRWTGDASGAGFPKTELSALVVAGERLFAIGSTNVDDRGGSRAAVWFSDDGTSWSEASGPFDESHVTALAGRTADLLLAGAATRTGELITWRSTDGAIWQRVTPVLPMAAADASIADLESVADGWLGVGSVSRGADAAAAAVIWRSVDGRSWSCQVLDPNDLSTARAWDLHGAGDHWLAIGDGSHGCWAPASCAGFPIAWSTVDGVWTNGYSSDREGGPVVGGTAFAADGSGFVAVRAGRAWSSVDGARWIEIVGRPDWAGPLGQADAIALAGDRLVVGGSVSNALGDDVDGWLVSGDLRR